MSDHQRIATLLKTPNPNYQYPAPVRALMHIGSENTLCVYATNVRPSSIQLKRDCLNCLGLNTTHIPDLVTMILDRTLWKEFDNTQTRQTRGPSNSLMDMVADLTSDIPEVKYCAPENAIAALRALDGVEGQTCVTSLIGLFNLNSGDEENESSFDDDDDDYGGMDEMDPLRGLPPYLDLIENLTHVIERVGVVAIPALVQFISDPANSMAGKQSVAEAFSNIVKDQNGQIHNKDVIAQLLTALLDHNIENEESEDAYALNACLTIALVNLHYLLGLPVIKKGFQWKKIDPMWAGGYREMERHMISGTFI